MLLTANSREALGVPECSPGARRHWRQGLRLSLFELECPDVALPVADREINVVSLSIDRVPKQLAARIGEVHDAPFVPAIYWKLPDRRQAALFSDACVCPPRRSAPGETAQPPEYTVDFRGPESLWISKIRRHEIVPAPAGALVSAKPHDKNSAALRVEVCIERVVEKAGFPPSPVYLSRYRESGVGKNEIQK